MGKLDQNTSPQHTIIKKWRLYLEESLEDLIEGFKIAITSTLHKEKWNHLWISDEDIQENQKSIKKYIENILEKKWDIENKQELIFDIFAETKTFLWRKLLFEHYIDEEFAEYKCFHFMNYSTSIDYILRKVHNSDTISIKEFLERVNKRTYNSHEITLIFKLIYRQLKWDKNLDMRSVLNNSIDIVRDFNEGKVLLSKRETNKILRSAIITDLKEEKITVTNIENNKDIYTHIPSIFGWKYSEKHQIIKILNGFLMRVNPYIKVIDKNLDIAGMVYDDTKNISGIKKYTEKIQRWSKMKRKEISNSPIIKWIDDKIESYQEWKIQALVKWKRKKKPNELSEEEHVNLLKKYILLKKILKKIDINIIGDWENINNKRESKIYKYILSQSKKRGANPIFTRWWSMLLKTAFIKNTIIIPVKYLKFTKVIVFIWSYSLLNKVIKRIQITDIWKRSRIPKYIRKWYRLESSTKILEFLVKNLKYLEILEFWIKESKKKNHKPSEISNESQMVRGLEAEFVSLLEESSVLLWKSFNEK